MARGGGCSIPVMVMSKQTSISDDTAATAAHYSGQRFRGAGWVEVGVQNVMLSELPPSLALSLSFFFSFLRPCPCEVSQGHRATILRILAQIRSRWGKGEKMGEEGRVEGVHHRELGKSHVCEMMIQLMAA